MGLGSIRKSGYTFFEISIRHDRRISCSQRYLQIRALESWWRLEKYTQKHIQEAADRAVEKYGDRMNVTQYWIDGQTLSVCFQAVPWIKRVVTEVGPPQTVTLKYFINSDGTMKRECLNLPRSSETFRIRNYIKEFTFEFVSRLRESEKEGETL